MKVIFLFLSITLPGHEPIRSSTPRPSLEVCLKEAAEKLAVIPADFVGAAQAGCVVVVPPTIDN